MKREDEPNLAECTADNSAASSSNESVISDASRLAKAEQIIAVFRLWLRHNGTSFSDGYSDESIRGIDLVMLESDVSGCIHVFLDRGKLDQHRRGVLYACIDDLTIVTLELGYTWAGSYFERLRRMAVMIVDYLHS